MILDNVLNELARRLILRLVLTFDEDKAHVMIAAAAANGHATAKVSRCFLFGHLNFAICPNLKMADRIAALIVDDEPNALVWNGHDQSVGARRSKGRYHELFDRVVVQVLSQILCIS